MTLALRRSAAPTTTAGARSVAAQVVLVAVALALRVPNLTTHELYRDDAWPALATRVGLREAVRMGVTVPGFEALLRLWMGVSRSTWWAQLPVLAASIVTVLVAYHLARRLGAGPVGSAVGAGILAVSPVSVLYATRVKPYSLDALDALVLVAAALWARQRPASRGRLTALLALAAATIVFSASILPVAVIVVAFAVEAALREDGARRRALVGTGLFGAFVLGWALVVLRSVPAPLHRSWDQNYIHVSSPWRAVADTWRVLDQFAAGLFGGHGVVGPVLLAAAVIGAVRWYPRLAFLLLGPLAIAVLLAALQRVPLGGGRIDAYLYPGVALAVGLVADRVVAALPALASHSSALEAVVVAGVVAFAATAGLHTARVTRYPSADVHVLDVAVRARMSEGDGIVISQFSRYPFALYRSDRVHVRFGARYSTGFTVSSGEPDVFIMPAEYYEDGYDADAALRFAAGRKRVWYIATDSPRFDTPADVQRVEYVPESRLLDAGYRIVDRIDARGAHADLLVTGIAP